MEGCQADAAICQGTNVNSTGERAIHNSLDRVDHAVIDTQFDSGAGFELYPHTLLLAGVDWLPNTCGNFPSRAY